MGEWSRRHLSFSSDWVHRLTGRSRSRSRSLSRSPHLSRRPYTDSSKRNDTVVRQNDDARIEFPSKKNTIDLRTPMGARRLRPLDISSRPRTSSATRKHFTSATPIAISRPHLRRSNSQGVHTPGLGPMPQSVRHWAHLHPARRRNHVSDENGHPLKVPSPRMLTDEDLDAAFPVMDRKDSELWVDTDQESGLSGTE